MTSWRTWIGGVLSLPCASVGCGGDADCGQWCKALTEVCYQPDTCVPEDLGTAASQCVERCGASIEEMVEAEQPRARSCIRCIGTGYLEAGTCDTFPEECQSDCDQSTDIVQDPMLENYVAGFLAHDVETPTYCTNGYELFEPPYCDGDFMSTIDGEACTVGCNQEAQGAAPVVGADCSGPADGPLNCTCTLGKNAGATFEIDRCFDLYANVLRLWTPCNL